MASTSNAVPEKSVECEASGVFWPVFCTLVAVAAVMAAVYLFWKYYWRIRHGKHLVLVTDVEKGDTEFTFDNPGFKEGTPVLQEKKLAVNETKKPEINGIGNGHNLKTIEEQPTKKSPSTDQKANVVALKSKDFTGLGFDICGNLRDGIFIKDLLHHGPASETGRLKAGDRISAVRINFSHMVYEDALSILSYASPYEVEVEVEDHTWSSGSLKHSSSTSQRVIHPFYRSQSFSSAQQKQKSVMRKLNFDNSVKIEDVRMEQKANISAEASKPAVLQLSEISEKMSRYGVKVLPDIKANDIPLVECQKQQNATVIDIEEDSGIDAKTPTDFEEVDLSVEKSKDNHVKTILVKGIQNLKEKLNNHMQKSDKNKEAIEESSSVFNLKVDEAPKLSDKLTRKDSESSADVDDLALKKSKRKAPAPPVVKVDIENEKTDFNLWNEIEQEVNLNLDTKSVIENPDELTTVTIHHAEELSRKATSLGDLSKIVDDTIPLERAVSLELADTPGGGKKRKAPMPPQEDEESDELRLESTLKKSSLFGTLEEVIKGDEMLTSTPLKLEDDTTLEPYSNISWQLNFDLQDNLPNIEFDGKVPDLPTTPMPNMPTYVTEIKVSDEDLNSTDMLFVTASELQINGVENSIEDVSDKDESKDSSIETVKCVSDVNGDARDHPDPASDNDKPKVENGAVKPAENEQSSPKKNDDKGSKLKSPNSTNKEPKTRQSISPVKVTGSRIPVRANTEPSLKVSLSKEDVIATKKKFRLSDDIENGKVVNFTTFNGSAQKSTGFSR